MFQLRRILTKASVRLNPLTVGAVTCVLTHVDATPAPSQTPSLLDLSPLPEGRAARSKGGGKGIPERGWLTDNYHSRNKPESRLSPSSQIAHSLLPKFMGIIVTKHQKSEIQAHSSRPISKSTLAAFFRACGPQPQVASRINPRDSLPFQNVWFGSFISDHL